MPSALRAAQAAAAIVSASLLVTACTGDGQHPPAVPTASTVHLVHPLPPGFSAPGHAVLPSTSVLQVTPTNHLDPKTLRPGPFPASQVTEIAQAIVNQPVPARVRPLLVSVPAFHSGQSLTVAAGDLGSSPHDVLLILQGPGMRAQRLVQANHGVSVATVTLPATMGPGTWALAAEDLSGVHAQGTKRPTGTVLLDLTVFTLPQR